MNFLPLILTIQAVFDPITKPIVSFCAGQGHTWGKGDSIGTSQSIAQVTCLYGGVCVLLKSGSIKCVGDNDKGQIGIGLPITTTPIGEKSGHVGNSLPVVNLGTGFSIAKVVGGSKHACIITTDAKVKCFGFNFVGQLGLGDNKNRGEQSNQMGNNLAYLELGTSAQAASLHIGATANHNCVILSKPLGVYQRFKCWGYNVYSQLGYGDTNHRGDENNEMGDFLPLVNLGTESRVQQLALGNFHSCALLINDALKCWGYGVNGQLGSGSTATISATGDSIPIVQVDTNAKVKMITAGWAHNCIVYEGMLSMKCFGGNPNGELGVGDKDDRGATPSTTLPAIPFANLGTNSLKISSIYTGIVHNCVLFEDSSVKCFGFNGYGQLGLGFTASIGDSFGEMGVLLQFTEMFSPTKSPSISPTKSPTRTCGYTSAKLCKKDKKCIWKDVNGVMQCAVFDCGLLNEKSCKKEKKRCKWDKTSSTCNPKTL